jgi:hypothetical protein
MALPQIAEFFIPGRPHRGRSERRLTQRTHKRYFPLSSLGKILYGIFQFEN